MPILQIKKLGFWMETKGKIRIWIRVREKSIIKMGVQWASPPPLPIKPIKWWVPGLPAAGDTRALTSQEHGFSVTHRSQWLQQLSQFPSDQDVGYEREEKARVLGLSNWSQIELSFSKTVKLWEEHVCKGRTQKFLLDELSLRCLFYKQVDFLN